MKRNWQRLCDMVNDWTNQNITEKFKQNEMTSFEIWAVEERTIGASFTNKTFKKTPARWNTRKKIQIFHHRFPSLLLLMSEQSNLRFCSTHDMIYGQTLHLCKFVSFLIDSQFNNFAPIRYREKKKDEFKKRKRKLFTLQQTKQHFVASFHIFFRILFSLSEAKATIIRIMNAS